MGKPRTTLGRKRSTSVKNNVFTLQTVVWPDYGSSVLLETKVMFTKDRPLYTKASMLDSFSRAVLIARTVTDAYIGSELEQPYQNASTLQFHKRRLIETTVEKETRTFYPDRHIIDLALHEEWDDHFTDITVTPEDNPLLHPFMVKHYAATKKPVIYRAIKQEIDHPHLYVGMVLAIGKADAESTWERSLGHV